MKNRTEYFLTPEEIKEILCEYFNENNNNALFDKCNCDGDGYILTTWSDVKGSKQ